jgi:hypothetical protein
MRCTDRQCQSEIAMSSKLGERAAIPRNQEYLKARLAVARPSSSRSVGGVLG